MAGRHGLVVSVMDCGAGGLRLEYQQRIFSKVYSFVFFTKTFEKCDAKTQLDKHAHKAEIQEGMDMRKEFGSSRKSCLYHKAT